MMAIPFLMDVPGNVKVNAMIAIIRRASGIEIPRVGKKLPGRELAQVMNQPEPRDA
jgi:hypothetical protein